MMFNTNADPTRVLVVGDTHGAVIWMRRTVIPYAVAHGCSRIVQVGDFGFILENDPVAVQRELTRLHMALSRAGVTLHFLPGRYENHPMLAKLAEPAKRTQTEGHHVLKPSILYTGRLSSWSWHGLRFAAVGAAASADREGRILGVNLWEEEVLTREEIATAETLGTVDILFTHDAPAEMPTAKLRRPAPDRQPMSRIGRSMQPKAWVHGCYHQLVKYRFPHQFGSSVVVGLSRDGKPLDAATVILDLAQFRRALGRST